jgi:hypothetical protein
MKTFSRLSLLTLLFLGIALILVAGTVDAQQDGLGVETDKQATAYDIGDSATVRFTVSPEDEIDLTVSWSGINVTSVAGSGGVIAGPYISGSAYTTDKDTGQLVVRGTVVASGAYVRALWPEGGNNGLRAEALLGGSPDAPRIVVDPPNVNDTGLSSPLQVGDTFTQEIYARDFLPPIINDLSAWQMQITYNPEVLQFVGATEGDFLENDGVDALFMAAPARGMIKAHQARIGRTTDVTGAEALTAPVAGVDGSGLLMTVEFELLEFAEEALGLSNIQLSDSQLTAATDVESQASRVSYHVVVNPIVPTHRFPAVDVNRDGTVDVMDLVAIAAHLSTVPNNPATDMTTANHTRADVNNDGFVNTLDIMAVASSASWGQAVATIDIREANDPDARGNAPQLHGAADVTPETIQRWIGILRVEDDGSAIFDLGIANLEALLASRIPTETRLLLNYPNPFNPETWIPYQLAEATDVRVMIHSVNGSLIRMLELGHQAAGTYKNKSQAAYWDGRNELGEQVASGLYFYTLTAGDFSSTGKMLIRK